jgi:hypothetical protein
MAWSRSGPVRSKPRTRATSTASSELDAATAARKTATIARRYSTGAILSGRRNEVAAPRRQRGRFKLPLLADQNSPSRATVPCRPSCSRASEMLSKRVFEKSHAEAIRFSIRRIEARSIIVSEVCTRYSWSLLSRRFLPSQAKLTFNDPGQTRDLERSLSSLDDP